MKTDNIVDKLSKIEIDLKTQAQRFLPHNMAHLNLQTHTISQSIQLMTETLGKKHPITLQLIQLDAAWCQLEMGLYGLCSDCEIQINHQVLEQFPLKQRCSSCEEKHLHLAHKRKLSHC
ncbi:TraR/DksA C4-type zinc finger protein [uncultured Shewanella sp.]|uniref:TraR/DksA C4-type zinc finger protein n=1 Tax=uncultured Shewanella sp. TaxID=173975 RepID=UPI002626443F|nr:TraR/DksA C4-type zinc finger protein [uncultured Shewanella sp.]